MQIKQFCSISHVTPHLYCIFMTLQLTFALFPSLPFRLHSCITLLQAARQRRRGLSASTGALSEASDGAAALAALTAGQTDQTSGKPVSKQKSNWLKHRLFNMSKGSLKNMEDEESDATSRASSAADLQASLSATLLQCQWSCFRQVNP